MASFRRKGKGWECRISFAGGVVSRSGRSKRQALARAEARKRELESGISADATKLTLAQYLNQWLDQHKKNTWVSTLSRYEQSARLYVVPYLGDKKLTRLTPIDLERLYAELLVRGRQRGGPDGLHPRTVKHVHEMLHKALVDATKWQLIPRNPADAVSAPKVPRRPVKPPDTDKVRSVLSLAQRAGIYAEIYTAVMTGLRPGELLALRWQDVDLDKAMARVVRAVQRVMGHGLVFKETKSHRGTRPIALSPSLVRLLRRHHALQAERRLLLGLDWHDYDLVLASIITR